MMGQRPPPDPLRLGDISKAGSSTGWTDEKHMLYITSLEESFVTQLYNREGNSKGLSCRSPGLRHKTSYDGNARKTGVHQGYWGMLEADGAESRLSWADYLRSPSCSGYQKNDIACYIADDASTNAQQERTNYHARPNDSGLSAASYLRSHGCSLSRITESSDQNFVDGETKCSGEQSRGVAKNT